MCNGFKNAILILTFASLCFAGESNPVQLVDDPALPAPKPGSLRGQISPAETVQTLRAVRRDTGVQYEPATFDARTGCFTFADLPGDAVYDICITTTDGRSIEGIDLSFVDARLEKLAAVRRKQLNLPPRRREPFTKADVKQILRFIAGWRDFMDTRRVLYLRGRGSRAVVLVELMRLREFYAARRADGHTPDIVWRIELWYFVRQGGGWERIPNVERVLRRVRATPREWENVSVEYDPQLSLAIDETGQSKPLSFTIPAGPDPTKGRPAHTSAKLKTQPHVSGMD